MGTSVLTWAIIRVLDTPIKKEFFYKLREL